MLQSSYGPDDEEEKLLRRALLGLITALALGACLAVGGGEAVAAPEPATSGVDRYADFDGDRAYCRQWCSYRVCNPQGECYRVYYCCG